MWLEQRAESPPPSLKSSSSAKLNNSCRSVTMYTVQQPTGDANTAETVERQQLYEESNTNQGCQQIRSVMVMRN